ACCGRGRSWAGAYPRGGSFRDGLDAEVNSIYKVNVIHETPAERRKKAQEARILDAALAIVAEGGLDALSIKAIAERADYSPAALYRYFASKDELVAALAIRAVRTLGEALAE